MGGIDFHQYAPSAFEVLADAIRIRDDIDARVKQLLASLVPAETRA
jgi:hypothetical protein